nr:MAG TPA: hypothetical protein [Caudoviricetes sp.]
MAYSVLVFIYYTQHKITSQATSHIILHTTLTSKRTSHAT